MLPPKLWRFQIAVLGILMKRGEITSKELREELTKEPYNLHVTYVTIDAEMKKMVEQGIVDTRTDKDRDGTVRYYSINHRGRRKKTELEDELARNLGRGDEGLAPGLA